MSLDSILSVVNVAALIIVLFLLFKKLDPKSAEAFIGKAEMVTATLEPYFTGTSIGSGIHVVDEILKAAKTGANSAEQLYLTNNNVDRKAQARDYVHNTLSTLKITLTPEILKIIDGAIEEAVFLLPTTKTADPAPVDPPVSTP